MSGVRRVLIVNPGADQQSRQRPPPTSSSSAPTTVLPKGSSSAVGGAGTIRPVREREGSDDHASKAAEGRVHLGLRLPRR